MAATGTPTPNIGLRIPQGTDPASVDDINYNSNLIDTKLGAVRNTSVQDQITALSSNMTSMGKFKFFNTSAATSVTLNLPSASTHFIFVGTNNRNAYAILLAVAVSSDAIQVTEISKGDLVTIDSSVAGKLTFTFDAARPAGIYDMAIRGGNITI